LISATANRPLTTERTFGSTIDQVFRRWKRNLLFAIAFCLPTTASDPKKLADLIYQPASRLEGVAWYRSGEFQAVCILCAAICLNVWFW